MEKFDRTTFYEEISRNKVKSYLLISVFFIALFLFALVVSFALAPGYAIFILGFASLLVIAHIYHAYNYGDKTILKAVNAQPADEIKNRHLIDTVEGLAIAAGLPAPKVYVMESPEINAFATGKDPQHASITFTTGALEKLKRDEIEGVAGHEMSHVGNFDIKYMTLVAALVGVIVIISDMFLRSFLYGRSGRGGDDRKGGNVLIIIAGIILAILAPIAARIVQASISRKRELLADATGAKLTRYPDGLANALERILKTNQGKMNVSEGMSHLFISDPKHSALDAVFATHPPLEERIKILRSM